MTSSITTIVPSLELYWILFGFVGVTSTSVSVSVSVSNSYTVCSVGCSLDSSCIFSIWLTTPVVGLVSKWYCSELSITTVGQAETTRVGFSGWVSSSTSVSGWASSPISTCGASIPFSTSVSDSIVVLISGWLASSISISFWYVWSSALSSTLGTITSWASGWVSSSISVWYLESPVWNSVSGSIVRFSLSIWFLLLINITISFLVSVVLVLFYFTVTACFVVRH